jgi:hypothetical protein
VQLVFFSYLAIGLSNILYTPWPGQTAMMEAGIYIRNLATQGTYASWNAGIYSYFSNKPVINLDGLANDEVLYFIKHNLLFNYIKIKNIRYIVDGTSMFTDKTIQTRGGYNDKRVFNCIRPLPSANIETGNTIQSPKIFEILSNCK